MEKSKIIAKLLSEGRGAITVADLVTILAGHPPELEIYGISSIGILQFVKSIGIPDPEQPYLIILLSDTPPSKPLPLSDEEEKLAIREKQANLAENWNK